MEQPTEVEVMDERWQALPEDLQDKALPFLSILELLRSQLVFKRWAVLITEPAFQATVKSKANYQLLMSANVVTPANLDDKWEICRQDILHHLSRPTLITEKFAYRSARYSFSRSTITADKGFICVLCQFEGHNDALFAITKSSQELPCLPRPSTSRDFGLQNSCIAMLMADDHLSFDLFVLQEASLPSCGQASWMFEEFCSEESRVIRKRDDAHALSSAHGYSTSKLRGVTEY